VKFHFLTALQRATKTLLAAIILVASCVSISVAQAPPGPGQGYEGTPRIPGQIWSVHDKHRPRPPVVTPAEGIGQPPSDAIVLFDGSNLDGWTKAGSSEPAGWKVTEGTMEVVGGSGSILSKEKFGDVQLHLEFATPENVQGNGQGRGNSGVILMGRYEIQVLDSYENDTYADGQLGAIYGQYSPQANPARKPGQWQTYDIIFEAPLFDGENLIKPAFVTVMLNGIVMHHGRKMIGQMAHKEINPYKAHPPEGSLLLQDHGNPTRFRNIWVRKLNPNANPWLSFPGKENLPGSGKKVVLISGDEEYRSEEALPMLAQILSEKHGFDCKVLFSINPQTGTVDPNYSSNIPGLHFLDDADLVYLFTRFRSLPDWQMKHLDDYFKRGGPFIAMRTATHAFNFPQDSDSQYKNWSWNSREWPGGFGQQVLGDTWVSHHGNHKKEATRGIIPDAAKDRAILNGVNDVFGPTDVYGIAHLPADAQPVLLGQVLEGMEPDSQPVSGAKNDPMMPVAWTREYPQESGTTNRIFTTTMAASIDLVNEGLRRLMINAAYWCTGMEDDIPASADVEIRGDYKPTFFGFQNNPPTYFSDKRLVPSDYIVD
jgi:hypothetical protein